MSVRSLSSLVAFNEAAESLSFVEAGRRLGISSSAVGKAIAKLEGELGVRLLHRSTRRISLTLEGAEFHARCRRALEDLGDAQATLSDAVARPSGRLRISLPTGGYHFLAPHLAAFAAMHPSIVLDLNYTDHLVDVIGDRFDAVVRSTRPRDSQLVARRLGAFAFRVCASPAYLARHGIPRTPSELVRHGCLLFRFETTGKLQPWAFRRSVLRSLPESVTCNSMPAVLDAAIRGLGLAFMPDFLAREAVAAKRLQYVLTDHVGPPGTFWMLWPQGARQTAKLRAFIDFFAPRLFPGAPG